MSKMLSDTLREDFELSTDFQDRALDDPVPGDSGSGVYGCLPGAPHETEYRVQRALLNLPVHFSSLQVRRTQDGVCLTGVVQICDEDYPPAFERVARMAAGVNHVLNRLVVQVSQVE